MFLSGTFAIATWVFQSLLFLLLFSFYGKLVLTYLTRQKYAYYSILSIIAGFSTYLFIAYIWVIYLKQALMPLQYFYMVVAVLGVVAHICFFVFKRTAKEARPLHKVINLFLTENFYFILFVAIILAFLLQFDGTFSLIAMGNNDVYFWSIFSDIYREIFKPEFMPTYGIVWGEGIMEDAIGTYFSLALFSTFIQSLSIESVTQFMYILLICAGLGFYECIRKVFLLPRYFAFILALMFISSPTIFYIAYNYFLAQIISTVILFSLILTLVSEYPKLINKIFAICFPLLALFMVYQSGFLAFSFVALSFACVFFMAENILSDFTSSVRKIVFNVLFPFLISLLLLCLLLPKITFHLIARTIFVTDVIAGWPLPLILPLHFLSLPNSFNFGLESSFIWYILYAVFLVTIFLLLLKTFKKSAQSRVALGLFLLFNTYVMVYLLYYFLIGSTYQIWKFLTFTALPLSFIPLSICIIILQKIIKKRVMQKSLAIFFLLMTLIFANFTYSNISKYNISEKINNIKELSTKLQYNEPLILDLAPYGDTLLAMSIFLDKAICYPLAISYVPVASPETLATLPSDTKVLGYKNSHLFRTSSESFELYYGRQERTEISGVYEKESWGRWSKGKKSQIKYPVSEKLQGHEFALILEVVSYLRQDLNIYVNGELTVSEVVNGHAFISIPIAADAEDTLVLDFYHPNAVSPSIIGESNDMRELAIGFIELKILDNSDMVLLGLNTYEEWGQWSDGDLITIHKEIPRNFKLSLDIVNIFGENSQYPAKIKIGNNVYELLINQLGTYVIDFENVDPVNKIEIIIPKPQSPKELGLSEDTRKLGYGFAKDGIRIE